MHRNRTVREPEALNPLRSFEGNKFEKAVASFFYWLRTHSRKVLLIVAGLVVAGVGSLGYLIYRDQVESKSLHAFEELMKNPVMAPGSGAEKVALEKLSKYEEEFSNNHAKIRSALRRTEILVRTGEKEKAAEALMDISRAVDTPELQALFAYRAGTYFEEKEKFAKAETAYSTASSKLLDENAALALALFGQGRVLILLGKGPEGREVLKRMMEIKEAENIADLRIAAAAFLIQHGK
ncbi:MAG: tetratricopeptide repeat protein [Spirochaetia bacterium]|nr:tetratricopeptide repeat protein [Spirochaetia bacterium]